MSLEPSFLIQPKHSLSPGFPSHHFYNIDHFSIITQKKILHFIKRYCNDLDIKVVFSSFKIGNMSGVNDSIPDGLRTRVVYRFACGSCNACYVGETVRHFSTRVKEHLASESAHSQVHTSAKF